MGCRGLSVDRCASREERTRCCDGGGVADIVVIVYSNIVTVHGV